MVEIIEQQDIKSMILTIRGMQVLLDSDVAMLYRYETRSINQAVKRNIERFPEHFCFQLNEKEAVSIETFKSNKIISKRIDNLISQKVISSEKKQGGQRKLPYVFSEQGIAMLAGILKNETAVNVSIGIMDAFVEMRRIVSFYGHTFERLTKVEYKLLEHDKRFDEVFDQIQLSQEFHQGVFYKGQIYDAFKLIMDIIRAADTSIIIIDNYADDSVLDMLTNKKDGVSVTIASSKPTLVSILARSKFTAQYPTLQIVKTEEFHDRFIIIDDKKLYHVGASLKDAGKKCFALSLIEDESYLRQTKTMILP